MQIDLKHIVNELKLVFIQYVYIHVFISQIHISYSNYVSSNNIHKEL